MSKVKISVAFRARLSEKLMDLGNLILLALAVGQFISKEFSVFTFATGVILTLVCYTIAYIVSH